jgi:tRNA dimethylallyltransferase
MLLPLVVQNQKTVFIICGPTASGKTSFAIQVAQHFKTQIISADSRQCYKELNIGVAKPSGTQLNAVHHHFINSHSITDDVNAAVFEKYALNAAETIFHQNDTAVMVGGTGLYIKAFGEGLDSIPMVKDNIRNAIVSTYKERGIEWLQQEVQKADPEFWIEGEQKNPHRLMRALEVKLSTGQSILYFKKGVKAHRPFRIVKLGLELPKEQLHQHINIRVDRMMEEGLVNEVKSLLPYRNLTALQTVGYREIFENLDGLVSLEKAIENIKISTRQYAKRQMTWFKKDASIKWSAGQLDNRLFAQFADNLTIISD